MPKSRVQRVSITVQPVPGNEPDAFEVEFHGSDGSRSCGHDLELPAGKLGMWKITATVPETITAGGGFLFQRHSFLFSHRIQDYNPEGRDFVTLKTQCDAALRLVVNSEKQSHRPGFAQVLVDEGEMKAGDSFTIQIGDSSYGGAGSAVYDGTTLGRITSAVDRTGDGVYRELACNPCRIHITSNPVPALLRLLGPSIVTPDEAFALHLMAFDANHNICEQFEGRVTFSGPISAVEGLPKSISLGSSDSGLVILEDIRISEPGLIRLIAEAERHGLRAVSNPILCKEQHDRRLLWGDLHCHGWGDISMSLLDDPTFKIHPERRHEQLRRVGRLDFGAPGPAVPPIQEDRPELWRAYQQAYRNNDEPGTYVPFLASEVHPRPGGDRNVIYREWTETYPPTFCTMDEVMAEFGDREDVILEAHIGGGPPQWYDYRPSHEPLLEVASGHGCFEWVLQWALRCGFRPAVIGSGDTHLATMGAPIAAKDYFGRWHNIGLNFRDTGYGNGPIAAVWAARCERNEIWKAIRDRRTFATTGARIILAVDVNGHTAGSEAKIAAPAEITICAHACAPVQRIDLIRNDRCLHSWHPDALDIDLTYVDEIPLREGAYYVRLRQIDGEYAWSTPIWTFCPDGSEQDDLPRWNAHEPLDLTSFRPNQAESYEADLHRYLEVEEEIDAFHDLTPFDVIEEVTGKCALFLGYFGIDRDPISIRWYFEFDMPKIHVDWGWRDFGLRPTPLRVEERILESGGHL
ncbi:MAG: DUF3604 domain-containing protein [Gemmatimonadetes bacterium]|nr:DUF3604 domain-containing protein [Gemmatimonadota bacterium]MYB56977.1 DUF3604 domain-containing protein [Gemmatimonadota bacterium]